MLVTFQMVSNEQKRFHVINKNLVKHRQRCVVFLIFSEPFKSLGMMIRMTNEAHFTTDEMKK